MGPAGPTGPTGPAGPPGPAGPAGPQGLNAIATPDPAIAIGVDPGFGVFIGITEVITASRTGGVGVDGTETYSWSLFSDPNGIFGAFLNPLDASSQRVQLGSTFMPASCVVRVTITDSAGNVATEDTTCTIT